MPGAGQASTCLRQTASSLPCVPWTVPHLSLPDSSLPAQLSSSLPRVTRTVTEHICTGSAVEGTELVGARKKPSLHQQSCVHCFSQCLTTGALCLDAPCCQPPTSKAPPACKWTPALGGDPHSVFRPEGTLATG